MTTGTEATWCGAEIFDRRDKTLVSPLCVSI